MAERIVFNKKETELKNNFKKNLTSCYIYFRGRIKSYKNCSYYFFKIPEKVFQRTEFFEIKIFSKKDSFFTLNYYKNKKKYILKKGEFAIRVEKKEIDVNENILSFDKSSFVISVISVLKEKRDIYEKEEFKLDFIKDQKIQAAIKFILRLRIKDNFYCIYDKDNLTPRMSYWFWNNAPLVSLFLKLADQKKEFEKLAFSIGDIFLTRQLKEGENKGALLSRYVYYGNRSMSFESLYGPNDTSFIVKWALFPLYNYTKDKKYLISSLGALDWVAFVIREKGIVPSHYYYERKKWESKTFIDAGFTPEGFVGSTGHLREATEFIDLFVKKYKSKKGFYVSNRKIFSRGQAWVLEGLIASYKLSGKNRYLQEAEKLADLMMSYQNKNGSWLYFLGINFLKFIILSKSKRLWGECEKTTAILGYFLIDLYKITKKEKYLKSSLNALNWCEENMDLNMQSDSYGGIFSRNVFSGIIDLPFGNIATGYANAFYVLSKIELLNIRK